MLKIDIYFWQWPTCYDSWTQYLTVTVEKVPRHIVDRNTKSIPQRERFIVSSSVVMYLKKKCLNSIIITKTRVLINLLFMTASLYLLMVTYAVVKLFLHATERFIRNVGLLVNIWVLYLFSAVLLSYAIFLSDIQEGQFELFQLTAGYTHTRVACRLLQPMYIHNGKIAAMPCKDGRFNLT
jgi:hypothetical protein